MRKSTVIQKLILKAKSKQKSEVRVKEGRITVTTIIIIILIYAGCYANQLHIHYLINPHMYHYPHFTEDKSEAQSYR